MKIYKHLKEKAINFRLKNMALDDIAERLNVKRTTVYYWIKDCPNLKERTEKQTKAQKIGTKAMVDKYAKIRSLAYEKGLEKSKNLLQDKEFRDFVVLYLAEGTRKTRNQVSICNSNPAIVIIGMRGIKKISECKLDFGLQYHMDQDEEKLKVFWAEILGIEPSCIITRRKSNSNNLSGRNWASEYGILAVRVSDTKARAELQAYMDVIQEEWKNKQ